MRLYLSSYQLGNKPEEMLPLIGGSKRTAVIMNALDMAPTERRRELLRQEVDALVTLDIQAKELDLRDYFGKAEQLQSDIADFDYIWVRGGNTFLLRRAFSQSGFDHILTELLQNDKVAYGGYSAGVCVLAPSLRGLELVDPENDVVEGYDKEVIWDGLGLLDYAVAPHYKSDHPESEDVNKAIEYFVNNHILFKALRDGEAIVVNGDEEKVWQ